MSGLPTLRAWHVRDHLRVYRVVTNYASIYKDLKPSYGYDGHITHHPNQDTSRWEVRIAEIIQDVPRTLETFPNTPVKEKWWLESPCEQHLMAL